MTVLATLARLESKTQCSTNGAIAAIKTFESDAEATPRVLAMFLMGLDGRWEPYWNDAYNVANAVFELMWRKRNEANRLETLLYMLDAFLSGDVIRMCHYELELKDTYFALIFNELSAKERVLMSLYVLDIGVGRIAEGKTRIGDLTVSSGTYAMVAAEFLFDEYSSLDLDELGLAENRRAAYNVLNLAYGMIMSESKEITLKDLLGATQHVFGLSAPDNHPATAA